MPKVCRRLFGFIAGGIFATLLTACGGGGGSDSAAAPVAASPPAPLLSGTFSDAPVAGAKYVTSSGSGGCVASAPCTTGPQGQFNYASGDAVTFSAAGVTLGTTAGLQPATDGSTTVTPVNLVAGASAPTDAGPTAIAQFLQTLNNIAAGTSGSTGSGVLTLPGDAATTDKLATALSTAGLTGISNITTSKLQSAIDAAFGANQFTVVPAATAQAALTQGVNSSGIVGTVWSGSCTCGGGATIYFQPDGTLTGFTDDGSLLAGSWSGSTTSGGGVSVQASSSGGGYGTGTIAAGSNTGTVTVYKSTGVQNGTLTFTKLTAASASAVTNSQYLGGWYATYTPNATRRAAGDTGGTAYIVAAANGSFYGITDGSSIPFKGTWTTTNGQGSASWTDTGSTNAISITIDLANANGTVSINGAAAGTLTLSRSGMLTRKNNQSNTTATIPLLLNVNVSWANTATAVSSLALGLNLYDSTDALIASAIKSESTALRTDGIRTTSTDNIAVPYPTGGAATYSLSVGPANCSITGGSGSIVDANSGNAGAYPTVNVTCDPNATTATPIPLLLNVSTTWGTTYPSPGYGLSLQVKDANGNQIASGFKQESVNLMGTNGMITGTTTTDNIAASYPQGSGVSYVLSTGTGPGAYCSITSGGSGSVSDTNSGNAGAYATVKVSCP